jgi:hypothetical protein
MREFEQMIVSCAITGAIHTPTMSPYLPVTPEEIAAEAIAAADAGASIVHVHVRDPETGEPTTDLDLFRAVAERVHDARDVPLSDLVERGETGTDTGKGIYDWTDVDVEDVQRTRDRALLALYDPYRDALVGASPSANYDKT